MAEAISPTSGRCYGVARICRVWEVPRSSFYAARKAGAGSAGAEASPARRGPKPAVSDPVPLAAIRAVQPAVNGTPGCSLCGESRG